MGGFFKSREREDWFLVDRGDAMPLWCVVVRVEDGRAAWLDLHGRCFPRAEGWPLAHVEAALPDDLLACDPTIAAIERDLAYVHLLDPWSDQGWIDRAGRFYGCAFGRHEHLMNALLRRRVADAEHAGFVRVNPDSFRTGNVAFGREPVTARQQETLRHLGFGHLLAGFRREAPHVPDRGGPPPSFAVRHRDPSLLPPAVRTRPKPDPREAGPGADAREAVRGEVLERLRGGEGLADLLSGDPAHDADFGGRWGWMLRFDGFDLGAEEDPADLLSSPGLSLTATAFDQVEVASAPVPGIFVAPEAAAVMAASGRGMRP